MWNVYILLCDNSIFYVGSTSNLERRIKDHRSGYSFYTKQFKKIEFVYKETYRTRVEAERREQQLKKWSVAKKKALISGDLDLLKKSSKKSDCVKE